MKTVHPHGVGLALTVLTLLLAGPPMVATVSAQCIQNPSCDMNVNTISIEHWAEGEFFFGKTGVYAGPSDPPETQMTVDGFFGETFWGTNGIFSFKSFKIDHPLDPDNRYLYHYSVESPEMKNIYDGVVQLDPQGTAWVTMPEWFDALNADFRYQLTAIGGPGSGLYIETELTDRRFRIAGGEPGLKVSWQVTGVRHDPSALRHARQVEEAKEPENRGRYLDPEAFGKPLSLRVRYPAPAGAELNLAESLSPGVACPLADISPVHRGALLPLLAFGGVLGAGGVLYRRKR